MQEVYCDQNTSHKHTSKDPWSFFFPSNSSDGLHVVVLAEVYMLYIRDRSLHHLDLESDFLSLSPPVILLLSNARVDESCRPSFRAADRKLIESEKKNQNACLRVEYHHNVIVGGWKGRPWTGEIQHGDVHGALPVDHHRGCRREGCHVRHGKGRGEPRRFESCCHFFRPRLILVHRRFPHFILDCHNWTIKVSWEI